MKKTWLAAVVMLVVGMIFAPSALAKEADWVYFYSPTCSSCAQMALALEEAEAAHPQINLIKYNIYEPQYLELLEQYGAAYGVPEGYQGLVPALFIGERYFLNAGDLLAEKAAWAELGNTQPPPIGPSGGSVAERFSGMQAAGVLLSGLVNGLNPCAFAMILFLLSIAGTRRRVLLASGLSFAAGKAVMFFLMGTLLYHFMASVNLAGWMIWIKRISIALLTLLIFFNAWDAVQAFSENYRGIRLQLPRKVRSLNHRLMSAVSGEKALWLLVPLVFVGAMAVSVGEFLCTGQIYLATIVAMLQSGETMAASYLALYCAALILPLVAVVLVLYVGRAWFDVSEWVRKRMGVIKLVNVVLLSAILLFLIFQK